MEEQTFTYQDWFLGKYRFKNTNASYIQDKKIIEVNISDLTAKVAMEIALKQKEIFEEDVDYFTTKWKGIFETRIQTSRDPNTLLRKEIGQCKSILNAKLSKEQNIHLQHWGFSLDRGFLGDIQNYYKRIVINGEQQDFSNLSSPNDPHRLEEQDPSSYSEAVFQHQQWLLGDHSMDILTWRNDIFDSKSSQELFMKFCEDCSDPLPLKADFCFIFHEMYSSGLIKDQQKHTTFRTFFNETFNTDFTGKDIPKRESKKNRTIYAKHYSRFKE